MPQGSLVSGWLGRPSIIALELVPCSRWLHWQELAYLLLQDLTAYNPLSLHG